MTCSVTCIFLDGLDGKESECDFMWNPKWKKLNKEKKKLKPKPAKKQWEFKGKKNTPLPEKNMELNIKVQESGNLPCLFTIHSGWVSLRLYSDNKSVCSVTYYKINQTEITVSWCQRNHRRELVSYNKWFEIPRGFY